MRQFAYIRKRIRRLLAVVFILLLLVAGLAWWTVHYRLRQSLRLLVAEESKGQLALEVGEAGVSFTRGSLHLREVRLYTTDTALWSTAYDVRIPEVFLSLASWMALVRDKKLLVDSLAIRASSVWIRSGRPDTGSARRAWQVEDARNALETALGRMNVHSFSLRVDSLRLADGGSRRLVAGGIRVAMKDFVRGGGRAVGFVSTHLFSLALSGLNWEAADRGQRLTLGRLSFDSRSRRCEADSVSFRQVAVGGRPYRFIADRCYFKSADLIEALSSKRFVLDTIVCVNPVLEEPMGVGAPVAVGVGAGRGGAGDTAASSVSVFVKYVAVIDGQVRLGGNKGVAASSLSTRRANCRIYGLSIDGSRKFPINTDSVRFSLDQLVFRTKDGRYALAVAGLGLEGGDAVFHGVSFGPVKENGESSTVFTAPELRLRNIAIDRLLEGRLHADGAVLSSPRVVMKKLDGMNKQAGPGMALVYRTMHDLREIVDAGALDISDGEIRYCRSGAVPVDAIASGFSAHILLNAVLGSDDLLDIKRAIPAAELGRLHATAGGQELEIRRYKFWGMRRHSEDKEVRVVLGNGSSVALRRVEWGSLDWDGFQRSGVIRVDTLHIGGVDLRQRVGAAGGVGTPGVGIPQLEIGALAVDSLFFSRGDEKQEVRFRVAGLAVTGMRTMDNLFCWEQASASIDSLHWRKDNARVSAAKMWLDSRTGVRVYGVEAQLMAGKGRVDVSAPQADIDVSFLAAAVPDRAVLRVPQATVTYERDSLAAGAVVEVSAGVIPGKSMRLYSLECSWKEAWARLKGVTREIEVDGAAGRLHTDSIHKDWRDWLDFTSLGKARVRCKMPQWSVDVGDVAWDPAERELRMSRLDVRPLLSRDSVFRRSAWQGDYLAGSAAALVLHGVMLKGEAKKPSVEIRRVRVEGASLDASRDKNMPFHHGIQKPMPTRLLASIPADVRIHQLFIDDSKVSYHERSAVTGRWGRVILGQLNAVVGPLVSRSGKGDTLAVDASAVLFDGHVRRFHYRESYADPNSGFEARVSFSPLDLTRLSDMSAPAGAVMITGGHVDTAWAVWRGNRYAAYGLMNLRYRDLQVKVLNKKDSTRTGLVPSLETFAANLILPGHNRKGSLIYFERDQEKFVFNYWIKTQVSGVVSTFLHKKNEVYRRLYEGRRREFYLPPADLWDVVGSK